MANEKNDQAGGRRKGPKGAPPGRARPAPAQGSAATRRDAQRQARLASTKKQQKRPWIFAAIVAAIAVVAVGAGVAYALTREHPGIQTPDDGREHLAQGVRASTPYSTDPPTSGPHWGDFAPIGRATLTNEADEANIHRLEHGYVIINYNCEQSKCPDVYSALFKIWQGYGADKKLVLNYRPRTKETIALTSWRRLETMLAVDEQKIKKFIGAYLDKGPEQAP